MAHVAMTADNQAVQDATETTSTEDNRIVLTENKNVAPVQQVYLSFLLMMTHNRV